MSDLRSNPRLAYALMKCADYLDPSTEVVPGIIYTTDYFVVQNIECDAALWMYSVVTIIKGSVERSLLP